MTYRDGLVYEEFAIFKVKVELQALLYNVPLLSGSSRSLSFVVLDVVSMTTLINLLP